jgi:secreted Zn-dependent insulinase-like peptidase
MEEAVRRRFEKIEAILQEVAERQTAAEERADRADARIDRMDARFEKRMLGFEKLVKIGMRELADLRRFNRQLGERMGQFSKETDHKINALIDSQQRTEASLRAFLDSRRGRNGGSN